MALTTEFIPLELSELRRQAAVMKADGWRFIQTHAVNTDAGIDLYYSFMKDGHALNYRVQGVTKDMPVPSITDLFLAAFVFENEARELFGVDMRDIALDFQGGMYAPAITEPMTIISPEQKAAREKARKAAAAKAAKEASAEAPAAEAENASAASPAPSAGKRVFVMTPELQARLDAKYPQLSDEKKAKVDAALAQRRAEAEAAASAMVAAPAQAAQGDTVPEKAPAEQPAKAEAQPAHEDAPATHHDAALEQQLAAMDADKAAKVRAALAGEQPAEAEPRAAAEEEPAPRLADGQLEALLNHMDDAKAATIRAAFARKGGK